MCALLFCDSLDHYQTPQLTRKWNQADAGVTIVPGAGRNGSQGAAFAANAQLRKTVGDQFLLIVGAAIRVTAGNSQRPRLITFQYLGAEQISVRLNADLTLDLWVPGQPASAAYAMSAGITAYVEVKVDFRAGGSYSLNVNGIQYAAGGWASPPAGSFAANSVVFGQNPGPVAGLVIDDVYILNNLTPGPADFLGDVMVNCLYPSAAGDATDWTPSAGSNYQNVREHLVDDDTTFNYASASNKTDLYQMDDLPATPASIFAIQWNAMMRKVDSSNYILSRALRTNGTTYYGLGNLTPGSGYQDFTEPLGVNPDTLSPWTPSEINALQAGLRLVSVS